MIADSPAGSPDAAPVVRVDALRRFPDLVTQLGGDPAALLGKARIDPEILAHHHAVIPLRSLARLMELAATDLSCPDFGMKLADAQQGDNVLGPLHVAMRNSQTVGDALSYFRDHAGVYSDGLHIAKITGPQYAHIDLSWAAVSSVRQLTEHMLLTIAHLVRRISGGEVRAEGFRCAHAALSPQPVYQDHFAAPGMFGGKHNALMLPRAGMEAPVPGRDPLLHEMATSFIDFHYPTGEVDLGARVGTIIEHLLQEGRCTQQAVAAAFGMHPRSLQRRLKAQGQSFETIRDSVRRDMALRYLRQTDLPLIRVAEILGYSDASVLTRRCHRWFSASPRRIRSSGWQAETGD